MSTTLMHLIGISFFMLSPALFPIAVHVIATIMEKVSPTQSRRITADDRLDAPAKPVANLRPRHTAPMPVAA